MCISFPTLFLRHFIHKSTKCVHTTHAHTTRNDGRERTETDKNEYTMCTTHTTSITLTQKYSQPAIHLHLHNTHAAGKQADTLTLTLMHTLLNIHLRYSVHYVYMRWQQIKSIKIRKSFFPFTSFCFAILLLHF